MRGQNLREVKIADLHKAKKRLAKYLTPTPLTSSELLNIYLGGKVYLKLENLQPACSYKIKYSLQGTTQGNGLTGGVPPVRFSM